MPPMPSDPIRIPSWALEYLIAPVAIGIMWVLWRLGIREMTRREEEGEQREKDIAELRTEIRDIKRRVQTMRARDKAEHNNVEQKLDTLLEEVT